MSAPTIDKLRFAKPLRAAGMPQSQAEAFAEAIAEGVSPELATTADLQVLKADLHACVGRFDDKLTSLKSRVDAKLGELRLQMAAMESRFEANIAALESRLLRWMGAGCAATIGVLAMLIEFALSAPGSGAFALTSLQLNHQRSVAHGPSDIVPSSSQCASGSSRWESRMPKGC